MAPRRRRLQEQPVLFRPPLTAHELGSLYERTERNRQAFVGRMWWGMILIVIVGSILTMEARRRTQLFFKEQREQYRVVVSISAPTPADLPPLEPLLVSLIEDQDFPPKMIYIVTTSKEEDASELIQKYVHDNKVYFLPADPDFGPINKYFYGVEMESYDTRIIAMGDSISTVERTFVSNMVQQSLKFPDAAIAYEGGILEEDYTVFETTSQIVDVLQGPTMVQRRFFEIDKFREFVRLISEKKYPDNIVLAAYFTKRGVEQRVVRRRRKVAKFTTSANYKQPMKHMGHLLGIWHHVK